MTREVCSNCGALLDINEHCPTCDIVEIRELLTGEKDEFDYEHN